MAGPIYEEWEGQHGEYVNLETDTTRSGDQVFLTVCGDEDPVELLISMNREEFKKLAKTFLRFDERL